jgi:diguanylate cyclase (GGDEF)-like protein
VMRQSNLHLYVLFGMIGLGIFTVSSYTLWEDRRQTWLDAEKSSAKLLAIFSRDIESNISFINRSVDGIVEGLRASGFQRLPADIRERWLLNRPLSTSFTGSFLVFNANGVLIADSGSLVEKRPFNASESDYFKIHENHPVGSLYLSDPYQRSGGDMSVALSRRISDPDGRFAGVVAADISLSDIRNLFKSLNPDQTVSVSLVRDDGILLVRQPIDEKDSERSRSISVEHFIGEDSGSFMETTGIDEVRRLYTFKRIGTLPLILTVSQTVDDLLAPWRSKARAFVLASGARLSFILGLFFLFWRELKRRTRAEEELSRLARTDVLTGLPNRRAFDETLEWEWRQATQSGSSLSLLYIDADFFKKYNDHFGHGMGDDLLRAIANTLKANIRRPRDVAARYGGEEFAVLLPETGQAAALSISETIRQAVTAMGVRYDQSSHNVVTISIGVASAKPSSEMMYSGLLNAADEALYRAKAEGRNCVRIAEEHGDSLGHANKLNKKVMRQSA